MAIKLEPGDLEACDAAMRLEQAEEDYIRARGDGIALVSTAHPRSPWYRRVWLWLRRPQLSPDSLETIRIYPALHASAPKGFLCADCTMDKEACPTCYKVWWQRRHPNVHQMTGYP
jgi:hypothetical protein